MLIRCKVLLFALATCSVISFGQRADPVEGVAIQLDRVFSDVAFIRASWGIKVQSMDTGQILYERNPYKLLMPASNMESASSENASCVEGEYSKALTRKAAISPREIRRSGQNSSLAGGLHPLVMPAA